MLHPNEHDGEPRAPPSSKPNGTPSSLLDTTNVSQDSPSASDSPPQDPPHHSMEHVVQPTPSKLCLSEVPTHRQTKIILKYKLYKSIAPQYFERLIQSYTYINIMCPYVDMCMNVVH